MPTPTFTYRIRYRLPGGGKETQTQRGEDLVAVIAEHGPAGASVIDAAIQCEHTKANGDQCGRFSHLDFCYQHDPLNQEG